MKSRRRVGIFGGSFNPIHKAHVALADAIRIEGGLDEVWFMVSPHNPLKQASSLMPDSMRLRMVEIALKDFPYLTASDYEFHLERPSYTWNTLQHLTADFPEYEFSLIIGADNWIAFPQWANTEDIIKHHNIYIYPREGCDINEAELPCNVHFIHTPLFNISSTEIREKLRRGEDTGEWLDENVEKFIKERFIKDNK